jgi:hypothetical protein
MLKIQIDGDPIKINYHISTPIKSSVPSVDLSRPTILFIRGVFVAQETIVGECLGPQFFDICG